MDGLGWCLAFVCALSGAVAQPGLAPGSQGQGNLTLPMYRMCLNMAGELWKVCQTSDRPTKALCSADCASALRTASVHHECSNVVTSDTTYGMTVQSHVNFRYHYCHEDGPDKPAARPGLGARALLRAKPVDPKAAPECFMHEDRSDYRGYVNTTLSGYSCQRWSNQMPHHHPHVPTEDNSWQGLGDHNYCRALSWDSCAWCYTNVHTPKWECCLIGSPQPSCPKSELMPKFDTLQEKDRLVLDEMINGDCPRMFIHVKLNAPRPPGKSGWYEVVSEASAAIGGRAAFQLSGHHMTLPGDVGDEVRGRLNANSDGVFRCDKDGLFFEPTVGGARTRVYTPSIPELNASIVELLEFKPDDEEVVADGPIGELEWWQRLNVKSIVYGGLGLYVGSMAMCAILAFLVGKGRRASLSHSQTPKSPGRNSRNNRQSNTTNERSRVATTVNNNNNTTVGPQSVTWREEGNASFRSEKSTADYGMGRVQGAAAATIQQRARDRFPVPPSGGQVQGYYDYDPQLSPPQPPDREPVSPRTKNATGVGGVKSMMVPFFRWLGLSVARNPWRTILFSCVFSACLTAGLAFMRFEADSALLFLPQHTPMALMRARYSSEFGALPDVIMMIVKRRAGGSIINRASLRSALELKDRVMELAVEPNLDMCVRDGGDCKVEPIPIVLSDFCVRRYIAQLGKYMCSIDSPLELWMYSRYTIEADRDVEHTLYKAYKAETVEMGEVKVDEVNQRVSTDAFMMTIYLNVSSAAYGDGRYDLWHQKLRERLPLIAQRESLEVTWWSTRLNEIEASSFVQKDAPLLAFSFIFVIVYVTFSLSRIQCSPEEAGKDAGSAVRIMLSLSCALCSALSLSSGFGLTALVGVPISPVTPLVSFMLLGVSVDNMIIIVDTFDRMNPNDSIDERLSDSLSESGTAITVTTFTTFVAFITGLPVDLPVYSYFCTTAACCMGCLYVLQLTLFCALLVIDTEGRVFDRRAYDDEQWDDNAGGYAYEAAYGSGPPPLGYAPHAYAENDSDGGLMHDGYLGSEHESHLQTQQKQYEVFVHQQQQAQWYAQQQQQMQQMQSQQLQMQQQQQMQQTAEPAHARGHNEGYGEGNAHIEQRTHAPLPSGGYGDAYDYGGYEQQLPRVGAAGYPSQNGYPPQFSEQTDNRRYALKSNSRTQSYAQEGEGEFYPPPPPGGSNRTSVPPSERASHIQPTGRLELEPPPGPPNPTPPSGSPPMHGQRVPPLAQHYPPQPSNGYTPNGFGNGHAGNEYGSDFAQHGGYNGNSYGNGNGDYDPRYEYESHQQHGQHQQPPQRYPREHAPPKLSSSKHNDYGVVAVDARQTMMLNYAKWLLSPWIKVLVIVTYLAPVIFAAFTVRDLKPGLPYRQTVPQNSIIMNFLDDVDEFYHGSFPVKLVVVFEKTAPEDFGLVREVLDGMLELPYINRVYPDWLADYETWYGCQGDMEDPRGMESMCNLKHFLSDGDYFPCDPTNFTRSNNRRQLALATSAANGPAARAAEQRAGHLSRRLQDITRAERAPLSTNAGLLPSPGTEKAHLRHAPPAGNPSAGSNEEVSIGHHHTVGVGKGVGKGEAVEIAPRCVNNDGKFSQLSGGHVCDEARSHCDTGTGHAIVRKLCPKTCGACDAAGGGGAGGGGSNSTSDDEFTPVLGGKNYEDDVLLQSTLPGGCDANLPGTLELNAACSSGHGCSIRASRFVVSADLEQEMLQSFYVWQEMTSILDRVSTKHGVHVQGYVYHVRFEFGFFDHEIITMGLKNLLMVVVVIAVCTLIFLPTFISILAVFTIVCIDLQLLSVMSLVGLNFNSISCISLLIALGLAIDYSVHLGHAYHMAPFDTREGKVIHALITMGSSILNAGGSTLLGTLFLAASDSVVFRTFFIFMWGTIFLGLFSGLAFAPIVLSLIGPLEVHASPSAPSVQRRVNSREESDYSIDHENFDKHGQAQYQRR